MISELRFVLVLSGLKSLVHTYILVFTYQFLYAYPCSCIQCCVSLPSLPPTHPFPASPVASVFYLWSSLLLSTLRFLYLCCPLTRCSFGVFAFYLSVCVWFTARPSGEWLREKLGTQEFLFIQEFLSPRGVLIPISHFLVHGVHAVFLPSTCCGVPVRTLSSYCHIPFSLFIPALLYTHSNRPKVIRFTLSSIPCLARGEECSTIGVLRYSQSRKGPRSYTGDACPHSLAQLTHESRKVNSSLHSSTLCLRFLAEKACNLCGPQGFC